MRQLYRNTSGVLLGGVLLASSAQAAEILAVQPLTESIVMVHIKEGRVIYHTRGMKRNEDKVEVNPVDLVAAMRPATYRIIGAGDPAYQNGRAPVRIHRKTKATEYAWYVDSWVNNHAVNTRPDRVFEHWIYLRLNAPLKEGQTYQLSTGNLATNAKVFTFRMAPGGTRSEAVHTNIVAYSSAAPRKYGYVYHWMGEGGPLDVTPFIDRSFSIVDATGKRVFGGKLAFRKDRFNQETHHVTDSPPNGNFLGTDVLEADFSGFNVPGKYTLYVQGVGSSFPFEISPNAFFAAYRATARALYHNRSGIALTKPYTEFERPAPHNPNLTPGFKGKLMYTTVKMQDWGGETGDTKLLEANFKGPLDVYGWYQDAGDWDSYVSHLRVPTEILFAYQLRPGNFRDGDLNIPESGNGIPDLLDEAAWLPRFCHRLRQELLTKKWGTGGIGLRVAGDAFGSDGEGRRSSDDVDRLWAVSGEDPVSTVWYAGVAAQLALAFQSLGKPDPKGVDWAKEAVESYDWAVRNTDRFGGEMVNVQRYAAASLLKLTGQARYADDFRRLAADVKPDAEQWEQAGWGPAVVAMGGGKLTIDAATQNRMKEAILFTAERSRSTADRRALRYGGNFFFPLVIGQQTTPMMLEVMLGVGVAEKEKNAGLATKFLTSMYTSGDFFLGTNALNMVWMTGVGPRNVTQMFHMDAWYNGLGRYQEGLIPYSPWRKEKEVAQGPWDSDWGQDTLFPQPVDAWPAGERYYSNRCSPLGAEFTVHQQLGPAAAFYGFLAGPARK